MIVPVLTAANIAVWLWCTWSLARVFA